MANLGTWLMGIRLNNPIIVGASGLTGLADGVEKAAGSGAGAIVLKSLFEEQILATLGKELEGIDIDSYPEAEAFIARTAWEEYSEEYLELIRESKKRAQNVPIFASINLVGTGNWAEFARRIEEAGADALELNIAFMPFSPSVSGREIEQKVLSTVKEARLATRLPIQVKLGSNYTSLPHLVHGLSKEGVNAVVLFNRFYRFDIDLTSMKLAGVQPLSSPVEYHETLRWTSILYKRAGVEIVSSTGIHSGEAVAKCILAGASATEVCSVIYQKGWKVLGTMLEELDEIVESLGFSSLDQMQGKMAAVNAQHPEEYLRLQYIKALTGFY
ncbi:MAG: dihydroorotate dehydrogenase-like protein [Rectinemataceae bacterium]|nr:dihydroorotate dehydrogenase-like protein [Spirochaetaceae bacterium]